MLTGDNTSQKLVTKIDGKAKTFTFSMRLESNCDLCIGLMSCANFMRKHSECVVLNSAQSDYFVGIFFQRKKTKKNEDAFHKCVIQK